MVEVFKQAAHQGKIIIELGASHAFKVLSCISGEEESGKVSSPFSSRTRRAKISFAHSLI